MKPGSLAARYVDVVSLIHKAPRTVPEIAGLVDLSLAPIYKVIGALEDEGLIERDGFQPREGQRPGQAPTVWKWKQITHTPINSQGRP